MFLELSLLSLKQNAVLSFPNSEVLHAFLEVFDHHVDEQNRKIRINPFQVNSPELKKKLDEFLFFYGKKHVAFKQMLTYLSVLPKEYLFLIVIGKVDDTEKIMQYLRALQSEHEKRGIATNIDISTLDWGMLLSKYNMQTFGHQRRVIGGGKEKNKKCRFCGSSSGEINSRGDAVSFKNKAHAISEALGNKNVEIKDECDSCNKFFSETIEPSLINYLSFFRSLYGLVGKGGKKKVIGKGFCLDSDNISIQYDGTLKNKKDLTELVSEHELVEAFVPQDLYRCLVKFLLSVVPNDELSALGRTIAWVNKEFDAQSLPEITMVQHDVFYTDKPLLLCYQLKTESELPNLVGEFHYADIVFVFIVPFHIQDKIDFSLADQLNAFWEIFEMSRPKHQWLTRSFLSTIPIKMKIQFNIKGIEVGKNAFVEEPKDKGANEKHEN